MLESILLLYLSSPIYTAFLKSINIHLFSESFTILFQQISFIGQLAHHKVYLQLQVYLILCITDHLHF
jgi:hypothetical protein